MAQDCVCVCKCVGLYVCVLETVLESEDIFWLVFTWLFKGLGFRETRFGIGKGLGLGM